MIQTLKRQTNLSKLVSPLHLRLSLLPLRNGDDHLVAAAAQHHGRLGHLVKDVLQIANLKRR